MATDTNLPVRFGRFTFDRATGELRDTQGRLVTLAPQPTAALRYLVERPRQLVTRKELQTLLWPGTVVEYDQGLNFCMWQIRKALGDSARQPRYLQVLPRRGYRFLADVSLVQARSKRNFRKQMIVVASLLAAAVIVALPRLELPRGSATNPAAIADEKRSESLMQPTAAAQDYAEARYLLGSRSAGARDRAVQYFERIVAQDPGRAEAWSGLASARLRQAFSPAIKMPAVESAARRAIALSSRNAEAFVRLGDVQSRYHWDVRGAEESYRRALELEPRNLEALFHYASLLSQAGRHNAAVARIEDALAASPVAANLQGDAGWIYLMARRYDDSIRLCKRALALEPGLRHAHECLIHSYSLTYRRDDAVDAARTYLATLGYADGIGAPLDGQPAVALRRFWALYLEAIGEIPALAEELPLLEAVAHTARSEFDAALDALELAVARRTGLVVYVSVDPRFDPLRQFERFAAIIAQTRQSQAVARNVP